METINSLTENLGILFNDNLIQSGTALIFPLTKDQFDCAEILDYCWKDIHIILTLFIKKSTKEANIQMALNSYQALINLTGSVGITPALQLLVSNLCKFALPSDSNPESSQGTQKQTVYIDCKSNSKVIFPRSKERVIYYK